MASHTSSGLVVAKTAGLSRPSTGSGKLVRVLAAFVLFTGLAGCAGFFFFISEVSRLAMIEPLQNVDGIVVLTGGKARVETAIELLRNGKGKRLLISGANPESSSAAIRKAVNASRELFDCCVDIDNTALDTVGNADQAANWAKSHGFVSLIVVTSDYHMPRSLLEIQRKLPGIAIDPHEVRTGHLDSTKAIANTQALSLLVPEFLKYVVASLRLGVLENPTPVAIAGAVNF